MPRSIRMHALIAYAISIDMTHANRKREHGKQGHKNKGSTASTRAGDRLSTTAGPPEALLVFHQDALYPRSTTQARRSSADTPDPSRTVASASRNLSSMKSNATGERSHIAHGNATKLDAIHEMSCPAYQNSLKERYRTQGKTTGGRQSRKSAGKDDAHAAVLVPKNKRSAVKRKPCASLFSHSAVFR